MKQSGGPSPSTYVSPKRRRKPGRTDFTDRRARKRKESRKKVECKRDHLRAPVKRRGAGLPVALKFCSIRKLILDSIVEEGKEFIENTVVENHEQEHEILLSGVEREAMTEELVFNCSQRVVSPQPSIRFYDSLTGEPDSQLSPSLKSDEVSITIPYDCCGFVFLIQYYKETILYISKFYLYYARGRRVYSISPRFLGIHTCKF